MKNKDNKLTTPQLFYYCLHSEVIYNYCVCRWKSYVTASVPLYISYQLFSHNVTSVA